MRHQTVEELRSVAKIAKSIPSKWELRRERLHRWAQLIEESRTPVRLFHQLEYMARDHRQELRSLDSPLSIAFGDQIFRLQGLGGEDYGSALDFFAISDHEAHQLLCDCHYGLHRPTPHMIATRIRALAEKRPLGERLESIAKMARSSPLARRLRWRNDD
jgi:hypothetical protein